MRFELLVAVATVLATLALSALAGCSSLPRVGPEPDVEWRVYRDHTGAEQCRCAERGGHGHFLPDEVCRRKLGETPGVCG